MKQPKVIHHSFAQYKRHNNWMTIVAFIVYALLLGLIIWNVVVIFKDYTPNQWAIKTFVIMTTVLFGICGYAQVIGIFTSILTFAKKKTIYETYDQIVRTTILSKHDRVAIVYCTKDDYIPQALETALNQTYCNVDVFVLDDSTNPEFIKQIEDHRRACNNKFTIVRRNGLGDKNKAGNINHFLDLYFDKYDYMGIMDADTYICNNFAEDCLKYFYTFNDVGIVQAINNKIVNVQNVFQDVCTPNYCSGREFWSVDGAVTNEYLVTMSTGHASVISLEKLKAVGSRLPRCISEDWTLSVLFKNKGIWCTYAPNVMCKEETPPNFIAWKKRQLRWETGSFQFFGQCSWRILFGRYRLSEKLYYIYATTLIWSSPLISIFLTMWSFGMLYQITSWTQFPFIPFVISMVLIGLSTTCAATKPAFMKANFWQTFKSMMVSGIVIIAMMPSAFFKFFTLFFTKKKFAVTIKHNQEFKWYDCFKYCWFDMLFWTVAFAFIIFTCVYTKQWIPVVNPFFWMTFIGYISLFFLPLLSNKKYIPQNQ